MPDGFVFPDGPPQTGTTPRQWNRVAASTPGSTPYYLAADLLPVGACASVLMWTEKPSNHVFGAYEVDGCDYAPGAVPHQGTGPVAMPFLSPAEAPSIYAGLSGVGCGLPPYTTECSLWAGTLTNLGHLSDHAVWFKVVGSFVLYLEKQGPNLILQLANGQDLMPQSVSGLVELQPLWPGEAPVTVAGLSPTGAGVAAYWRGPAGLYAAPLSATSGVGRLVVPGARRALAVGEINRGSTSLMVHADATGGATPCASGCELWSVAADGVATKVLAAPKATGNEVPLRTAGTFLHQAEPWAGHPAGPCPVISLVSTSGAERPLGAGTLWPAGLTSWTSPPVGAALHLQWDGAAGRPARFTSVQ